MGNLGHLPWPLSETYGFHLDVLAALEGLCTSGGAILPALAQISTFSAIAFGFSGNLKN